MAKPVLYIFAISHYCEKARWALDRLGIAHDIHHTAPGLHLQVAKKLGAPRSSLPILVADGQAIQGSAAIIDWADAESAPGTDSLTPEDAREECLGIEKRLDDVLGVHLRRYYYSEALVDHPETVRPIFTKDLPLAHRLLVRASWGAIRKKMIAAMDLGPEPRLESKDIVAQELDWLDGLLSDGRELLAGQRFSRTDITAASLLSPLVAPKEHPTYAGLQLPPLLSAEIEEWEHRPSLLWVRQIYANYR